ncbi:ATP-dependent DNA helicase (recombination protein S) [Oceanobacillus iheyensis HTE831]|uniref:ATP-dependent DNA helicase (Recombination protein S) n=1 Tax=Oceanobacillus iheyensis (strain DSM 14371 / CIP 107618 / JCM 11309 / KCTC 3954 / HTE831) TaxID=221109 RepID=Q8CXF4_OCEIH|nr:ATP-dependent DNA helicase RecQ [Oceanobacillus iheyensis]BAC13770.1 ATP-dependent DNA helicase (recombination protein S) [Oceanobacillus iheyensis HTE831]
MVQPNVNLQQTLKYYFQYDSFRQGQEEIITDVMNGNDVLGVLPTGSGKSICYQLPAILQDGVTIVVSPLISLMIDQVKELKAKGIKKVIALNSFLSREERYNVLTNLGDYRLIYVSPEWLQNASFVHKLKQINVTLFVIDEAHCISQWGHEFRPDYLKLHDIIAKLENPTILALSATATPDVQEDIIHSLNRSHITKHIFPMDRDNIAFCIETMDSINEKKERIQELIQQYHVPTLIYFTSRYLAEETSRWLSSIVPDRNIAYYHGGMEATDRVHIQQQFMNNQLDVICCTSAFGMGINKSDIRLVIHYHLPSQIESYIQEVGRAGRDGEESVAVILYATGDWILPKQIIQQELPMKEDIYRMIDWLKGLSNQDQSTLIDEEVIANLQISEVQWRFIRSQLEKHDMIVENQLITEDVNIENIKAKITNHIEDRLTYKEKKLKEMIHWVNSDQCYREKLYMPFQNSYRPSIGQCCSNCGFQWSNWQPETIIIKSRESLSWESKLQSIFHITGVEHETR